jgi:hypothetical protein
MTTIHLTVKRSFGPGWDEPLPRLVWLLELGELLAQFRPGVEHATAVTRPQDESRP